MAGQALQVPAGATVQFGAPADPLPEHIRKKITAGLSAIPEVIEAHLPMCQVFDVMPKPAQILAIVLDRSASLESTMPAVLDVVRAALQAYPDVEVWPIHSREPLLKCIRKVNCRLLSRTKSRRWWQLWS